MTTTYQPWSSRLADGGHASTQREHALHVETAHLVRNYEWAVIPGLLQSPGYARAVFTALTAVHGLDPSGIEAAVEARMDRQEALGDHNKTFLFLVDEAALHRYRSTPDVQRRTLEHLTELIEKPCPNIEIRILPFGQATDTPQNSFLLLDDITAVTETHAGEHTLTGPDATVYVATWNRLWTIATAGSDARDLIARVAESLLGEEQ